MQFLPLAVVVEGFPVSTNSASGHGKRSQTGREATGVKLEYVHFLPSLLQQRLHDITAHTLHHTRAVGEEGIMTLTTKKILIDGLQRAFPVFTR